MTNRTATKPGAGAAATETESRAERLGSLGAQIRALRTARGMSSVALARACGVSPSLVSQVERALTAPSLEVLWAFARALDVPIGTFFQQEPDRDDPGDGAETATPADDGVHAPPKARVVRADRRKRLGMTASLTYQLLSPDLQHRIELVWVEFGPGEEGPFEPYTHAGEEQMVVISGEMHVWIDGEEWRLGTGDAITFDSALPHRAINRGSEPAIVIAAITPPSF